MDRRSFLRTVRYNLSQQRAIDNARAPLADQERKEIEVDLLAARVNDSIARYQTLRENHYDRMLSQAD